MNSTTDTAPPGLRLEVGGQVAVISLARPERLNALDAAVFAALRSAIDEIATTDLVHCVVLTGDGRSFCSGHDLTAIGEDDSGDSRYFEAETLDALERLPQPTIAKVRGHCFTGGLELALACDLIVASRTAVFADTHGTWGLVPVWGMSVRLPERVGVSTAKRMMFTGERLDGESAARIGLADIVAHESELDHTVEALVAAICANSPGTNHIAKSLLQAPAGVKRAEALRFERSLPFGMPTDMHERLRRQPPRDRRTGG